MTPKVIIDIKKLKENVITLKKMCNDQGVEPFLVSKVVKSDPEILRHLEGLTIGFADSRLVNLERIKHLKGKKMLVRIPMLSELEKLVELADYTLISEVETIKELDKVCEKKNKKVGIILMTDLGDLREGEFYEDNLYEMAKIAHSLKNIELVGLGANLTCYGAILPSEENLTWLANRATHIEEMLGIELKFISGVSSNTIPLLKKGIVPKKINSGRIGEAFFIGYEVYYGEPIEELSQDVAILEAEIIELKTKPSMPVGESGKDAFGHSPQFEDKGERLRAILAIGQQDVALDSVTPTIKGAEVIGASSDHMIVDITDAKEKFKLGDTISFNLGYSGLLRVFTSEFIYKEYKND